MLSRFARSAGGLLREFILLCFGGMLLSPGFVLALVFGVTARAFLGGTLSFAAGFFTATIVGFFRELQALRRQFH